jgi:hypothetical protein
MTAARAALSGAILIGALLFLQLRSTGRQRHVDVKRPTMIDDYGRT